MIPGRWGRAVRALRRGGIDHSAIRVLDVGCAFGFGTSCLPGFAVGIDRSSEYLRQGRHAHPRLTLVQGDAVFLPFVDNAFDAAVALDVLEHLADPGGAVREIARTIRPGGPLVVSVPNRGWLANWDSLNQYENLRRSSHHLPPLDETERSGTRHRHYSFDALRDLLGSDFEVRNAETSGIGLAEILNLALLIWCRGILRSDALYRVLRYFYYVAYLIEDVVSLGRGSYHLLVFAERRAGSDESASRTVAMDPR